MIYLIFSICCSVGVAAIFRYSEGKSIPRFGLLSVNYLIAVFISLPGSNFLSREAHKFESLLFAAVIGVLFVAGYILLMIAIKKLGIAIPVALMRLSAVLPTIGSIMFFSEIPEILQVMGIGLAFLSLPLAGQEKLDLRQWRKFFSKGFGWALVLFFSFGITEFALKVQTEVFPTVIISQFLLVIFSTAFLISMAIAIFQKTRFSTEPILLGILLGILNYFSTYLFIKALQLLPGIMVYPTNSIGIIILSTIIGFIIWKERLSKRNFYFLLLASVALVLIHQN